MRSTSSPTGPRGKSYGCFPTDLATLEQLRQDGTDFLRCHRWRKSGNDRALGINEELGEVPGYRTVTLLVRSGGCQPLIQRTGTTAINVDLAEHREVNVVLARRKREYLGVAAGLLSTELIARKRENRQTTRPKFGLKGTQTCVLWRQPSTTRDIDDETVTALEHREINDIAADSDHAQGVEAGHGKLLLSHPELGRSIIAIGVGWEPSASSSQLASARCSGS